jgi:hypothetical protein
MQCDDSGVHVRHEFTVRARRTSNSKVRAAGGLCDEQNRVQKLLGLYNVSLNSSILHYTAFVSHPHPNPSTTSRRSERSLEPLPCRPTQRCAPGSAICIITVTPNAAHHTHTLQQTRKSSQVKFGSGPCSPSHPSFDEINRAGAQNQITIFTAARCSCTTLTSIPKRQVHRLQHMARDIWDGIFHFHQLRCTPVDKRHK